MQGVCQRRRGFRLDADELDCSGVPGGDAADETAATHGNEQRVEFRILLLEFEADGSLTEQGFELIVSMNGHSAGLRGPGFASGEGIGVALAADDEIRTTAADALDFFRGSDGGYKNFRGHAQLAGGKGDGDSMVATGRGDDARFGNFVSEQIGKGASRFERAGVLQEFQFEDEADRIQSEVGASSFEDRRAAHVGSDDFFDRGDALAIKRYFGHGKPSWGPTPSRAGAQQCCAPTNCGIIIRDLAKCLYES